jgi:DNA-binding transcriptional ArsR family regulator
VHDDIWKALADPTRRAILDLLREEPRSTGQLVGEFPHLDRCTVMKHLDQLAACKLVLAERQGRNRINYLNPIPLQEIVERWVRGYSAKLAERALDFKRRLEHESQGDGGES